MSFPLLTTNARHQARSRSPQADRQLFIGLLFLVLSFVLSGCSLLSAGPLLQRAGGPVRATVDNVPFYPQEELQCGPAVLAMALNWSGIAVKPSELTPEVFTPDLKGSLQSALIGATRRHGRVAYPITGSEALLAEVSAGNPVIVLVNLGLSWYPKWHYAVVIGFDQEREEIILHSGLTANEHLSFRVFKNIWRRGEYWGLLVLPPNRLPAGVGEGDWLEAVAGLEGAGQWQGAADGYGAALKLWPKNFVAWMGLGNSRYSLNELAGSVEAFHRAAQLQPENGMPFNNLALVLSEQGKSKEAMVAAQRAVDLGGPHRDDFLQTLEEIKGK